MTFLDAVTYFADDKMEPMWKAKSDYALQPLTDDAINLIVTSMASSPNPDDFIQFDNYGGAVNRVPADATAFPHRAGTLFSLQYLSVWDDVALGAPSLSWIRTFYDAMRPCVSGYSYANYCDLDLESWATAYYGANIERLVSVKNIYDPDNVFTFAQSIPTAWLPAENVAAAHE